MTGFNRRFSPAAARLRELLAGRTSPLVANYRMNAGYIPLDHWVHGPEGGGRNIGEACHIYDLFDFLVGAERDRPCRRRRSAPASRHWAANDNFVATIGYADGSVCTLTYTALGHRDHPKERLDVFAGGRVLSLDDYKSLSVDGGGAGWRSTTVQKGHVEELEALARALREGGPWPIPLEQQLQATRISFEVERQLTARRRDVTGERATPYLDDLPEFMHGAPEEDALLHRPPARATRERPGREPGATARCSSSAAATVASSRCRSRSRASTSSASTATSRRSRRRARTVDSAERAVRARRLLARRPRPATSTPSSSPTSSSTSMTRARCSTSPSAALRPDGIVLDLDPERLRPVRDRAVPDPEADPVAAARARPQRRRGWRAREARRSAARRRRLPSRPRTTSTRRTCSTSRSRASAVCCATRLPHRAPAQRRVGSAAISRTSSSTSSRDSCPRACASSTGCRPGSSAHGTSSAARRRPRA